MKSALAGLAAGVATVIAIIVFATRFWIDAGRGSGSMGFISFGISGLLLLPFVMAFALGFHWMFRRQRRRNAA